MVGGVEGGLGGLRLFFFFLFSGHDWNEQIHHYLRLVNLV